jgi:MEMO1 family protein
MPSPDPERPGLFIRDPYHYSDATLLVPPPLVPALDWFDGHSSTLDLRAELVRITGEIQVGDIERHLFEALNEAGFLENDRYLELKNQREAEFAAEPIRMPNFADAGYPAALPKLSALLNKQIGESVRDVDEPLQNQGKGAIVAIAAPHASPDGGWGTYRAAYRTLPPRVQTADVTFVILGTSHYGAPERFGLTRKNFKTPFGDAQTNTALVNELFEDAKDAAAMEDYCHAVEHSIEFQVVMLQHIYGPDVRILPILCGPFVKSIYESGLPEDTPRVARFFDALGNIAAREGRRLLWVLGVDMAHMGRRYSDPLRATANIGEMLAIEQRDRERIAKIAQADVAGYWSLVQERHDDLKWCGSAPFYTFMKVMPGVKGELLNYHQWQIDPHSVVSFGALRFA